MQTNTPIHALLVLALMVGLVGCAGAPRAKILAPQDGKTFHAGELDARGSVQVTAKGEATDEQDGTLTGQALTWKLKDVTRSQAGWQTLGTGEQITFDLTARRTEDGFARFLLMLNATDSDGKSGNDIVKLNINIPN